MKISEEKYQNFLQILLEQKNPCNPFTLFSNPQLNLPPNASTYNYFGFNADLFSFEIKCAICLGRVKLAKRPDNCRHIFCGPCLTKWHKNSNKCPCCRKPFKSLIKVDYSEKWVSSLYNN